MKRPTKAFTACLMNYCYSEFWIPTSFQCLKSTDDLAFVCNPFCMNVHLNISKRSAGVFQKLGGCSDIIPGSIKCILWLVVVSVSLRCPIIKKSNKLYCIMHGINDLLSSGLYIINCTNELMILISIFSLSQNAFCTYTSGRTSTRLSYFES